MTVSRIDGPRLRDGALEQGVAPTGSGLFCCSAAISRLLGVGSFRRPSSVALLMAAGALCATTVIAQAEGGSDDKKDPSEWVEEDAGIPVTDQTTIESCAGCHQPDAKGNLSRISWVRTTPEGWAQTIKRMVKLNGASITPENAKAVIKYLGTYHGLAPEEAKPVMYLVEKRIQDETIIPDDTLRQTCASCHAFAQPMSSRRSKREWALLQNMHKALYSTAERIFNTPVGGNHNDDDDDDAPAAAGAPKKQAQSLAALDWLAKNAPLHTPEWAAWRPRIKAPMLAGKWLITGSLPGKGRFVGEMTVAPKAPGSDEFVTTSTLRSLSDGRTITRKGTGLVYAGYSWRGSSASIAKPMGPDDLNTPLRETMWFAPDQTMAVGRWYWGEYQEFGLDVAMRRETGGPVLAAATPDAVKTGTQGAQVHLYGAGLPADLTAAEVDFGEGVTVRKVAVTGASEAVVTVDVAADAVPGMRDVSVRGAVLQKALPVFTKVDYIRITPETALAHLGGIKYGKGYEQFAAFDYSSGPDGKPGTPDDFAIRPADVTWSLGEFPTVTYDDDTKFVGKLDAASGFFTPAVEGPNPERRFMRNNYGEVWVVATSKAEKDKSGKPLSGRAYLVTTVPTYKRWDQPEVSQ